MRPYPMSKQPWFLSKTLGSSNHWSWRQLPVIARMHFAPRCPDSPPQYDEPIRHMIAYFLALLSIFGILDYPNLDVRAALRTRFKDAPLSNVEAAPVK